MSTNGLNSHPYHDNLLLFSGLSTDRLWWLNLSSFVWHEETCSGVFPPLTRFHATALCGSRLYVCGGESMNNDTLHALPVAVEHDVLDLFVIDLKNLQWEVISCDWKPKNRSHHTMTAVNNEQIVVIGGKPPRENVTSFEIREMLVDGLYAVHIFDVGLGLWRVFSQPYFPLLWGHSAHMVNGDAILLFGGFETTLEMGEDNEEVPTVGINNYMRFLNFKKMECYCAQTRVPGRVLHQSHVRGDKLCVLGGYSVDESRLTLVLQRDAIEISLVSFETRPMMFCFRHWPPQQLVSVVYNQQLIVLKRVDDMFLQRANSSESWERYRCDSAELSTSPFSDTISTKEQLEKKSESQGVDAEFMHADGPLLRPSISPVLRAILSRLEYFVGDTH